MIRVELGELVRRLVHQIVDAPADVAKLAKTWEIVRNEALPRRQSTELIKEVAKSWAC
ncbi:hypothetical protein LUPAC06_03227 [Micromonospora saelicesensis]|uniref:hypothetical protein n=1 Tax=Micromonospora saelicesensis TaxID=285676 RepID=UPI000DBFEA53|nr:hypothetical protein LUPAC06_03227 [Micromonospora saelicesensis]